MGARAPAARADIQELLRRVLEDGHELTEDDMVTMFAARGADFHAVCSAAGATMEKKDMEVADCGILRMFDRYLASKGRYSLLSHAHLRPGGNAKVP